MDIVHQFSYTHCFTLLVVRWIIYSYTHSYVVESYTCHVPLKICHQQLIPVRHVFSVLTQGTHDHEAHFPFYPRLTNFIQVKVSFLYSNNLLQVGHFSCLNPFLASCKLGIFFQSCTYWLMSWHSVSPHGNALI